MKNNLRVLYHNYLKDIGQLPDISLGDDDQKAQLNITRGQNEFFIKNIYQQGKVIDKFIGAAIAGIGVLVFLALFYHEQPLIILIIFVFVLVILFQLKKFWLEKNLITISIGLVSDLPPQEAAVYIHRIYMQILQPKSPQAIDDFANEVLESPSITKRKKYSDKTNEVRKLIVRDEVSMALKQLDEIIDQHDFLKKEKNTKFILSHEQKTIKDKTIKGINVEKGVSNNLNMRILEFCDEIDNAIEEFYQ